MILVLWKCCSALIVTVSRIGKPFPPLRSRDSPPQPPGINLRLAFAGTLEGPAFLSISACVRHAMSVNM